MTDNRRDSVTDDRRIIEDYLPIQAISRAASSEPRTKGHLSTLHIWRARRPLVACRAAVYGALVPVNRFLPKNAPLEKQASLARANAAAHMKNFCTYTSAQSYILDAAKQIREAHAQRLAHDSDPVLSSEDMLEGAVTPPRVLDMFAGGGAIPLEAARLGCETYALDINPVAYLIELCTTTFPQKYGVGLADEVEKWGKDVLKRTKAAVSDVLSAIPYKPDTQTEQAMHPAGFAQESLPKQLSVVAYYWTRTVSCPNPACRGTVPLYRQTWLRKKPSGYVALEPVPDFKRKIMRFKTRYAASETDLEFDPAQGRTEGATGANQGRVHGLAAGL